MGEAEAMSRNEVRVERTSLEKRNLGNIHI